VALLVVASAALVFVLTRGGGQLQVSADVLPLPSGAHDTTTFVDCSQVGLASYVPNRPCDTYFLITDSQLRSATTLLRAEQLRLRAAQWHYTPATTFGQTLAPYGWVGPHHTGCAIVVTAAAGGRAQMNLELSTTMPSGVVAFGRTAQRAGKTATLQVLLQARIRLNRPTALLNRHRRISIEAALCPAERGNI
jgi:hypothetical protein